jgi:hypothetical protein
MDASAVQQKLKPGELFIAGKPSECLGQENRRRQSGLKAFREKNPDIVLVPFNGFGGDLESTGGPLLS